MRKYFDVYYPEAMKRAATMREAGAGSLYVDHWVLAVVRVLRTGQR